MKLYYYGMEEWVRKVANLSRLELSEEEITLFSEQLPKILELVKKLEELDTEGVDPYIQKPEETPMREDKPRKVLSQEEALRNAPEREKGFFVVPKIVEV